MPQASRSTTFQNADAARVFEEIADLLDILGENTFRVRAYRNAARTLTDSDPALARLLLQGKELPKLPGIGPDLEDKLHEIARTGTCALLEELRQKLPAGLLEILKIPGLGPKKVKLLYNQLDIQTPDDLLRACEQGKVHEIRGFAEKTEQHILEELSRRAPAGPRRYLLSEVALEADAIREALRKVPGVSSVIAAGSYRRGKETVGDLDMLAAADDGARVIQHFARLPGVTEVIAKGTTRATVRRAGGMQVDLRVVPAKSLGAALHYFTGSKAHNIAVRQRGLDRKLKVNEYGVYRGTRRIAGETEESVYAAVGLPYIPPELREDRGEIAAAEAGRLPKLVAEQDLRGDLHAHTVESDGKNSLAEMADAARKAGLTYLAVTDHSPRVAVTKGLDADRLRKQGEAIDRLNETFDGFTLLKGCEVDILEDGRLDLPDAALKRLDVVVASLHTRLDLPAAKQTARVLRALDNRYVNILGHPTARLLLERDASELDLERIIRAAARRGIALEVNAHPHRLDLPDVDCQRAKDLGACFAIDSDAHGVPGFANLRFGVQQARRGWLEAADVLNTLPLAKLRERLAAMRG